MKTRILNTVAFFLLVLFTQCAQFKLESIQNEQPPGTIAISSSLDCDVTEINCFHWLEYLFWTEKIYGEGSPEYTAALPNTADFLTYPCNTSLNKEFFRYPIYRTYPIQGITQEQARKFSQWRSDRVFEYYFIRAKIFEFNPNPTPKDFFTIERYFTGYLSDSTDFYNGLVVDRNLMYPKYALPTDAQRAQILDYVDSTDFRYHEKHPKEWQKWLENAMPFQLEITAYLDTVQQVPLRSAEEGPKDKNHRNGLLYNIRGNVAEWGDAPGISYGGGWIHNLSYTLQNDAIPSSESNGYTGFRNVCTWQKWTP